ncbi:MAG: TIGR01777 family oxidoreductase, partial [Bacteroidota bacterium]
MANILIGGGSGFVGSFLSKALVERGHDVHHLSRKVRPGALYPTHQWDVFAGTIDEDIVTNADYVINLAGAGIADGRWTNKRKKLIIDSRVKSTALLAATFAKLDHRPKLYLSASAIGFYGHQGEKAVDETNGPGTGFLSESTRQWEHAVQKVSALGIPTFINRTGIVMHPAGGAMQKMVIPLQFFMSTYFGNGKQWYSWIHMEDIVGIFIHAIENQLTGTYNGVAPYPARNSTIAKVLPIANEKPALVLHAP